MNWYSCEYGTPSQTKISHPSTNSTTHTISDIQMPLLFLLSNSNIRILKGIKTWIISSRNTTQPWKYHDECQKANDKDNGCHPVTSVQVTTTLPSSWKRTRYWPKAKCQYALKKTANTNRMEHTIKIYRSLIVRVWKSNLVFIRQLNIFVVWIEM